MMKRAIILLAICGSSAFFACTGSQDSANVPKADLSEQARAASFTKESCQCMMDNFNGVTDPPDLEACVQGVAKKHSVDKPEPNVVMLDFEVDGVAVKQPKIFEAEEANRTVAVGSTACMMKLGKAVSKYKPRAWTDADCASQCVDEGEEKQMCMNFCALAREK